MKNLEQIRAKNALQTTTAPLADTAKKVTTMIMDNGLLATCAFAKDKKQHYDEVMEKVRKHLSDPSVGLIASSQVTSLDAFIDCLCKMDASLLRTVTAETLAFMNYMRRLS